MVAVTTENVNNSNQMEVESKPAIIEAAMPSNVKSSTDLLA